MIVCFEKAGNKMTCSDFTPIVFSSAAEGVIAPLVIDLFVHIAPDALGRNFPGCETCADTYEAFCFRAEELEEYLQIERDEHYVIDTDSDSQNTGSKNNTWQAIFR